VQVYNLPKFDGYHERAQPPVLQNHIKEIEAFSRKCHNEVVVKLLRLFAIILELPDENQLVKDHEYDVKGEDHLRYMHYAARSPEINKQVGELYSPGHTDLGSVTLLFRQPVAALQILNSEQQWKWVKPQDETITINICDALQALTGNFFKSSIHRVHSPPDDQAHVDRLGVLFFARYVVTTASRGTSSFVRSLTASQTQQPRRLRPHLQQPSTQPPRLEGQRSDQAWATFDHGAVGESAPVAATASHKGSQDRRPEVRVWRERDGDHSWSVGEGAQLSAVLWFARSERRFAGGLLVSLMSVRVSSMTVAILIRSSLLLEYAEDPGVPVLSTVMSANDLAGAILTNVLHHIRVSRTLIGTQVLSISSPMDKDSLKRA
jgi:hypothetical protein